MEIVETRYPFENAFEFLVGGYAFNLAGLHLVVAYFAIFIGAALTLKMPGQTVLRTFSILYIALQPFNNPAFTAGGLSIADLCGLVVAFATTSRFIIIGLRINAFVVAFSAFALVATLHAWLIWVTDPAFAQQAPLIVRFLIVAKIAVFTTNFIWIFSTQRIETYLPAVCKVVANFTAVICVLYLLQLLVFLTGHLPYGTFSGAGRSLTVAFGGVSLERGHLSKFMAPLFLFILIDVFLSRRFWKLGLYAVVMAVNFSASGLSFLTVQILVGAILFRRQIWPLLFSFWGAAASAATVAVVAVFADAYGAILEKVYRLAIRGDESDAGGRSVVLFIDYLRNYPLGIGYSGSTYRVAPGLPEINMGIYAFVTQLSGLSLIFIGLIILNLTRVAIIYRFGSTVSRLLLMTSLSLPFIFSADILWFVPLWWLPLFWLCSYQNDLLALADTDWRQAANDQRNRRIQQPLLPTAIP